LRITCHVGVENTKAYIVLVGKPESKRLARVSRRRQGDNILMDLEEIGWEGFE